jgi:GNAT superfamily N-acetyltransferase
MVTIEQLTAEQAQAVLDDLVDILRDSVESSASIGFLPPLADQVARDYWAETIAGVAAGTQVLLIARQGGAAVGTVQLALATKPNAPHRAEVQKLLVHTRARRKGIGEALMQAVEAAALEIGRTLLVLDTRQGDPSEQLYLKHGYVRAGVIPQYVRNASGDLQATVLFYKLLG